MTAATSRLPGVAMAVVGLHPRIAKPRTQRLQSREVMLDLEKGDGPFVPQQVLKQLGVPGCALFGLHPNDAHQYLIMQKEIIGARRQPYQLIGHSDDPSDVGRR